MDRLQVVVNSKKKKKNPPNVAVHLVAVADFFRRLDAFVKPVSWVIVCMYSVGEGVILKLPAPRMNTDACVSPRHPALHQSSAAIDVRNGSTRGKTQK